MRKSFVISLAVVVAGLALGAAVSASAGPLNAAAPAPAVLPVAAAPAVGALAMPVKAEDVVIPITPCRIVDTRSGARFGNLVTRTFFVGGTTGFAPQGGKSGGCGIPTTATAIAATITAVSPSHSGFVRAWPSALTEPGATLLNYGTFSMGTGATVPITMTSGKSLAVKNYGGPTDIVIDVTGYYAQQIAAKVDLNGTLINSTSRVLSSTRLAVGTYRITVDTDISACSIQAQSVVFSYYNSIGTISGNTFDVYNWRVAANTAAATLADGRFFLTVNC